VVSSADSAGRFVCPACGAGVAEGARRCAHCDAPVATVRCAACFHMSAPDAAHCAGCGRNLGLEPIPRSDQLGCPDCHTPMSLLDCGPGAIHDCGRCGGQFIELAALRDLIERHDRLDVGVGVTRASASARSVQAHAEVRYVACPVCRALMNRRNFGGASGVIVDVCAKHGTWFDLGELPRALAFVESGGLTRARQREAQERHREARERTASAAEPSSIRGLGDDDGSARAGGSILSDLLDALFGD
jgi:Zn-finger nucleic acid-binding protein